MSKDVFLLLIQSISFPVSAKRGKVYSKRLLIHILINVSNLTIFVSTQKQSFIDLYFSLPEKKKSLLTNC